MGYENVKIVFRAQ